MIYFGIESSSQKVLDYYKKGITPNQSEMAVAKARKAGVDVIVGSFIIGAPNETKKDIQKTFDFAQRIEVDIPQISILEANPGTPIWDEFKNNGLLREENYWETGVFISDLCKNTVPINELKLMIHDFYKILLKRPRYILKQLLLTIGSSYRQNVVLNNLNRISAIKDNISNL